MAAGPRLSAASREGTHAARLIEAGDGLVRLMTLAPETDTNSAVTGFLVAQKIAVACGHSDADLPTLRSAVDAGLTLFTHVGNGCPQMMARHDNVIQRILSLSGDLWFCFIADGCHVPFFALGNYMKTVTYDRTILVADAMAAASAGTGRFTLGRWKIEVSESGNAQARDGSHFLGSTMTLAEGVQGVIEQFHIDPATAVRMVTANPALALGLGIVT